MEWRRADEQSCQLNRAGQVGRGKEDERVGGQRREWRVC